MPRSERTRPATKSDARLYAGKATQFLSSMERALSATEWDSVVPLAFLYHKRAARPRHRVVADSVTMSPLRKS